MAYAVFDWDNTIRKGFTLFSWMDFLYSEEILDTKVRIAISGVQDQYMRKQINHDEYAKKACEIYSYSMKGVSEEIRDSLIKNYIQYDRQSLMPFSEALFEYMNSYNIKPIIISGAPQYILEEYKNLLGLGSIYAFSEQYNKGLCTGDVAYNYGINKGKTIEKLYEIFGTKPLVGFGDSYSDIPLFNMSEHAFCITQTNEKSTMPYGKGINYVSDETTGRQIKNLLHRILSL